MDTTDLAHLRSAFADRQDIVAIHYSCESFLEAKDHPPAVAAVAVYDLKNGSISCYSRSDAPPSQVDKAELRLLKDFYADLSARSDALILHWNMDRPEFGFDALAKRFRYLVDGDEPPPAISPASRRFDVDELIAAQFGPGYAPHGKLESTAKLNGLDMRSFLSGKVEAESFQRDEWGTLVRSTSSKAKIIGQLCANLMDGSLKTTYSAGTVLFGGTHLDAVATVLSIGHRYVLVRRSLGKHPHGREPVKFENEWDDQYIFRALLTLFFDDIREEDPVQSTAGSGSRIDFTLPDFGLGIELKHTRQGLTDAEIGSELSTDRARYASRSDITHLLCLVFDPDGRIRNPRALEKDLSNANTQPGLTVTVQVYDR